MKTILYLGTDPIQFSTQEHVVHYPVIKIIPRSAREEPLLSAYAALPHYTHFIFTSKNAVEIFFQHLQELHTSKGSLAHAQIIAVGEVTESYLKFHGLTVHHVAKPETQEGLIALLAEVPFQKDPHFFLPRSSLSRPLLVDYLKERGTRFCACDLYDTITRRDLPKLDLHSIDEILFTSPSTVRAFIEIFGQLPKDKKLLAIGPITEQFLRQQANEVTLEVQ